MTHWEDYLPRFFKQPSGRLVSLLSDNGDFTYLTEMTLQLGHAAAAQGETVLMLDCCNGQMMEHAGIDYHHSLKDVVLYGAPLEDALYISADNQFTAAAIGDLSLSQSLGSLAALSLSYDWLFVIAPQGCSSAHIDLARASDISLLGYDTAGDSFMRAFWYIDAVRKYKKRFDPYLISTGLKADAVETAMMLRECVKDFIGAPPPYAGHIDDHNLITRLLDKMGRAKAIAANSNHHWPAYLTPVAS